VHVGTAINYLPTLRYAAPMFDTRWGYPSKLNSSRLRLGLFVNIYDVLTLICNCFTSKAYRYCVKFSYLPIFATFSLFKMF